MAKILKMANTNIEGFLRSQEGLSLERLGVFQLAEAAVEEYRYALEDARIAGREVGRELKRQYATKQGLLEVAKWGLYLTATQIALM